MPWAAINNRGFNLAHNKIVYCSILIRTPLVHKTVVLPCLLACRLAAVMYGKWRHKAHAICVDWHQICFLLLQWPLTDNNSSVSWRMMQT